MAKVSCVQHGSMETRGDRYQRQAPEPRSMCHPKQAQMQMEPGPVPCGGRRVEVRMPMRRAGSRGVLAMMRRYVKGRADTDAPCGYRCAVRVTGQASSCAHILSHPLSAACRPVSPRRVYLSKVEAAQPLPRESSLGRPSGMISRGSYAILVWVDGIGIVRVSPLGAAVRAVSCRASPVCPRRARAYLV
jgi:hypothetical protein